MCKKLVLCVCLCTLCKIVCDIKTYPYKVMILKKAFANVTLVTILDCLLEGGVLGNGCGTVLFNVLAGWAFEYKLVWFIIS